MRAVRGRRSPGARAHPRRSACAEDAPFPVDAIEIEQVVDQTIHLAAAVLDRPGATPRAPRPTDQFRVAADRLHRTEDAGERSLEVVGDRVSSVSFTSFISRRSLERSASCSNSPHCASMIERNVSSSIAAARKTANRTMPSSTAPDPWCGSRAKTARRYVRGRSRRDDDGDRPPSTTEVPGHETDRHEVEQGAVRTAGR